MRYADAACKLRSLGCEELPRRGPGSHHKWHNPSTGQLTSLPDGVTLRPHTQHWGHKHLKLGTLRSAVRQLGLDWQDFLEA